MKKTGLYIGRFQPFHTGHLSIVKRALKEVEHLIIGIGSAQYHNEEENPFNAEEREKIITLSLEEAQVNTDKYHIVQIKDIHNNAKWPEHVIKTTKNIDIVFVGDDGLVKELFEEHTKIPVHQLDEEIFIRGTRIREKMVNDESWEKWISPSAVDYIKKIKGVERLISLSSIN